MQRVTITIDDDLLAAIDALAQRRGYQSRSEAMRDIVRSSLASTEPRGDGACVAALSYVYDHHTRDLARRITDAQHHHHALSVAALHVHLDARSCLEIAVLKGRRRAVAALADEITSQRGVRHGHLHLLPQNEAGV